MNILSQYEDPIFGCIDWEHARPAEHDKNVIFNSSKVQQSTEEMNMKPFRLEDYFDNVQENTFGTRDTGLIGAVKSKGALKCYDYGNFVCLSHLLRNS